MMDENWLANVVMLAHVVVLLDSFSVGYCWLVGLFYFKEFGNRR
jgi:hypothetical protein